jgi:hypothetical protein
LSVVSCGFLSSIPQCKGGTQTEGVREQGAEGDIGPQEAGSESQSLWRQAGQPRYLGLIPGRSKRYFPEHAAEMLNKQEVLRRTNRLISLIRHGPH